MEEIKIKTPLTEDVINSLKAGDRVTISGVLYTARDAAHKRLVKSIDNDEELPFDIKDSIIYYVGPCPPKPGEIIGAAGPTTSYRMDDDTPPLLEAGLKGMIGKGKRNDKVIQSIVKNKAVYFTAIGGAGALIADCIKASDIVAYEDLGTEAIRRFVVENFPAIVVIDSKGNNLYNIEVQKYKK